MEDVKHEKRMLNIREGIEYTSLKRSSFEAFAESIGAVRRFGRRKLYDKLIIDAALDNSKPGEDLKN